MSGLIQTTDKMDECNLLEKKLMAADLIRRRYEEVLQSVMKCTEAREIITVALGKKFDAEND